jgi:hypothetical protein
MFTKPKAIVTLIFALIFLLDASLILSFMGIELSSGGVMFVRILGGVYLGAGIGFWLIAGPKDISAVSAYLYALGEAIAAVVCLTAIINGDMNSVGFVLVIGYALFACGFVWVAKAVRQVAL